MAWYESWYSIEENHVHITSSHVKLLTARHVVWKYNCFMSHGFQTFQLWNLQCKILRSVGQILAHVKC